jgi:hypothetical protein
MRPLQALIVGMDAMAFAPIRLLRRAGFEADRIRPSLRHRNAPLFRRHFFASDPQALLDRIIPILLTTPYDPVVISDDSTLQRIAQSTLPEVLKQRLLPVVSPADRSHLQSKIGLSKRLESAGIRIPRFQIAQTHSDLLNAAARLRFAFQSCSSWMRQREAAVCSSVIRPGMS